MILQQDLDYVLQQFNKGNLYADKKGIARWKTNESALMKDVCEVVEELINRDLIQLPNFSKQRTLVAREIEVQNSLAEYRKNYKGPNEEELAEMRCEFGKGTVIVDVITGKEIKL